MWAIFRYGVPVLGILGLGHATFEIFTGKVDAKKMGLMQEHIRMFGVLAVIQTLSWILVIVGLRMGAAWPRSLAIFATALFMFDYLVSLPSYKNLGDKAFKYWAGVALLLLFAYILWA